MSFQVGDLPGQGARRRRQAVKRGPRLGQLAGPEGDLGLPHQKVGGRVRFGGGFPENDERLGQPAGADQQFGELGSASGLAVAVGEGVVEMGSRLGGATDPQK